MHLDEERVQRLLDGELSQPEERAAREHVASCEECRSRLAGAERVHATTAALLTRLDAPEPPVDFIAILEQVRSRGRAQRAALGPWRWAAGFILVVGIAGLAYAIPGSPLRGWIDRLGTWVSGRSAPVSAPEPEGAAGGAGIAVAPGDRLLILFQSASTDGTLRVSWTDGHEVVVRAFSQGHTFTSDADRLVIANRGAADSFEIEIPRSAPHVEIRVGPTPVFLEENGRVVSHAGTISGDVYEIPLNR